MSISSNIAEGFEKSSVKDMIRFAGYAKGSCGELRSQTYIGIEVVFINKEYEQAWLKESIELSKMIASWMNSLEKLK